MAKMQKCVNKAALYTRGLWLYAPSRIQNQWEHCKMVPPWQKHLIIRSCHSIKTAMLRKKCLYRNGSQLGACFEEPEIRRWLHEANRLV